MNLKKTIFSLLLVLATALSAFSINGVFSGTVANFPKSSFPPGVLVSISMYDGPAAAPGALIHSDTTRTDSNGFYTLSYNFVTSATFGISTASIVDCRTIVVMDTASWDTSFLRNPTINLNFCPTSVFCNAAFQDSLIIGSTYFFKDLSTAPPNASYSWDFGDATSSTTKNPTHTYTTAGSYYICLTIADTTTSCLSTYCDSIFVNAVPPPCSVSFTFNIIGTAVQFSSTSSPDNHVWDFGDSSTDSSRNPTHTYSGGGVYNVCLTVFNPLTSCSDSLCIQLTIPNSPLIISGVVSASGLNPGNGWVYLIKADSGNVFSIVDTALTGTATAGNFSFNVNPGNYYLKAELASSNPIFGNYIPTYFDSALSWVNSTAIIMTSASAFNKNISLIPTVNQTGPGRINGLVSEGENKVSGPGDPYPDASVVLTSNGVGIAETKTDINGNYSFLNLPYGTYQLFVEIIGKTPYPRTVVLSADNEIEEEANFVVRKNGVTTGIDDNAIELSASVYPNPMTNILNISFDSQRDEILHIMMSDMLGNVVRNKSVEVNGGNNLIELEVDALSTGMYMLRIKSRHGYRVFRVIKE